MKEKLKNLLFPEYTQWEKLLITKHEIRYRLVMARRNTKSGLYQFKSVYITDLDECPTVETISNLIK